VSGADPRIRKLVACGAVPDGAVGAWIASSRVVLVGTGVAATGTGVRIRKLVDCGAVTGCAVGTCIASSKSVLVGTGAAVSGVGAETDLGTNGFAMVEADPVGSLADGAGVWAAAGSSPKVVLKLRDVLTDDGASNGSASKELPVT
jgi:hypothetical protein